MKAKIVTAYWMDVNGYPFQGSANIRKDRYLGSLKSHCENLGLPVICYTHELSLHEVEKLKNDFNLDNLEIKLLELKDVKYHNEICQIRDANFDQNLDGRGTEIMWGKFDILERELDDCDRLYWVDCGLQHPGIFPWRYSGKYNKVEDHNNLTARWWEDYDVHNFKPIFNEKIFEKLNTICEDKITLLTSINPQISYRFKSEGLIDYDVRTPFPVGGLIGGDTKILKKYVQHYWEFAKKVLDKNKFLCTEEAIMKIALDNMDENEIVAFKFSAFWSGEHDQYHFEMWTSESNNPKPLYMVWYDILNYNDGQ